MASRKKSTAKDLAPQSDPRAPLDGALLLAKAQGLLAEMEADLLTSARKSVATREALRLRHEAERKARRTADPLEVWERHFVTQVAASWVVSCVFVRILEDRGLLGHPRIAGPGAADSQRLFFEIAPSLTAREYLLTVFRELARLPAARDLFDARHNPVWMLGPTAPMANKLLALFREPSTEAPGLRFGQADTRFLGDLYQDLSADVRERYALLQTPHFVEKYILDRTLERAIERFGLDETTLIDPTCGSGHFLLGAFERLVDHRLRKEPGLDVREAARRALDAVYGADINPYAVAIARFRLTLAFLEKAGYTRLAEAPVLPLHLVVADSLLHAPQQAHLGDVDGTTKEAWGGTEFALEDEAAAKDVLLRRYAAVVGNPPYITVKDAVLRERYRELYPRSAAGKYSLGAPFTERFFLLAKPAGFVGMITANSFMKREFGKKLIEQFLPTVNLDGVVNTSGAYIPGHGTPTVLLFGTSDEKQGGDVLTVLAKRGEPSTPEDPEQGLVWRSIEDHGSDVGFENDYLSVARVPRATLEKHPWSLGGGGAAELKELLEERAECRLGDLAAHVGISAVTGEDEVYLLPEDVANRLGIERTRAMLIGEEIRDWSTSDSQVCLFPYGQDLALEPLEHFPNMRRVLWRARSVISKRKRFGTPMVERGLSWYELQELYTDKLRTPLSIAFAFVATHNHFVLDRGGKVFNRSAPVIKLKEGATEEDHLALLAYLNSSTACFWMKQVFFDKGNRGDGGGTTAETWEKFFEYDGTKLKQLPIPSVTSKQRATAIDYARQLLSLGQRRQQLCDTTLLFHNSDSADALATRIQATERSVDDAETEIRTLQENLDWFWYAVLGISEAVKPLATVQPGKRAADIVFANEIVGGGIGIRYFELCRLQSPELVLAHQPPSIHHHLQKIHDSTELSLIEAPTYKRTFREGFRRPDLVADASEFLLTSVEHEARGTSSPWTGRLAIQACLRVASFASSLQWLAVHTDGASDCDEMIRAGSAPYLAALRHTESGLEKRATWERVWDLQRAEDRGESVPPFDPPPKYDQKDFRDATGWRLRGKLDVPKERFISYPGCESDEDHEPVYGWAGWNHLQQAQALAALYQKRKTEENWGKDRLTPMLAGLLELVPWVKQWHNEPDADFGGLRLGDYFETFLDSECHTLGLTREDLRAWRPVDKARGKRAPTKKAAPPEPTPPTNGDAAPPKRRARSKSRAQPQPPESDAASEAGEPT